MRAARGAALAITKRSNRPRLTEQAGRIEEAKLQALKQAADEGCADASAGRYTDVDDDRLEDVDARFGSARSVDKVTRA